jgi:hypothetical protein
MRLGVLIDGEAGDSIEVGNRGFNYGDGAGRPPGLVG